MLTGKFINVDNRAILFDLLRCSSYPITEVNSQSLTGLTLLKRMGTLGPEDRTVLLVAQSSHGVGAY